jgi:hypothetical protein
MNLVHKLHWKVYVTDFKISGTLKNFQDEIFGNKRCFLNFRRRKNALLSDSACDSWQSVVLCIQRIYVFILKYTLKSQI